jgi:hypothetical protein
VIQLLLPVIQTIFFFGAEIFNPQKKKSAKIKCLLFRPKPQKFHTAEITGYTVLHTLFKDKLQFSSCSTSGTHSVALVIKISHP